MIGRERVAWNLRRIRTGQGISQERLADEAGLDRKYVGVLERRESGATVDVLERLAGVLRVDIRDLLDAPVEGAPAPAPLRPGRRPQ